MSRLSRPWLWLGFGLVHLTLSALGLIAPGWPLGDVQFVYSAWTDQAETGANRAGIDSSWVYPILAFVPMAIAGALPFAYDVSWLVLVTMLNAGAFAVLLGRRLLARARAIAAIWWLIFLLLLGPIALGRIDSVTVPLALAALLWGLGRPALASALLVAASWMKVWPGALWIAMVIARRGRWRMILVAAALSAFVVAVALLAGAGANVFSFVSQQSSRGLQVEALGAIGYLWLISVGSSVYFIEYDTEMLTFQVYGPGVLELANLLSPLLLLGVLVIAALGVWAARAGTGLGKLLPSLALALTMVLIVFNKVGSPQFVTWLAPAIVLGLVLDRHRWLPIAVIAAAIAALTQVIYPYWYGWVLSAETPMLIVLSLRAALELGLLATAVTMLVRDGEFASRRALERVRTNGRRLSSS